MSNQAVTLLVAARCGNIVQPGRRPSRLGRQNTICVPFIEESEVRLIFAALEVVGFDIRVRQFPGGLDLFNPLLTEPDFYYVKPSQCQVAPVPSGDPPLRMSLTYGAEGEIAGVGQLIYGMAADFLQILADGADLSPIEVPPDTSDQEVVDFLRRRYSAESSS